MIPNLDKTQGLIRVVVEPDRPVFLAMILYTKGALDGGVPMSRVEIKARSIVVIWVKKIQSEKNIEI